jgi:DNA polymerase III delta prime subunit
MFDARTYFENALAKDTLPSVLLLIGQDLELHAKELATKLLATTSTRLDSGNHPDYHVLHPEGKSGLHTIDSLRLLIDQIFTAPFEATHKVFLIHNAERMQPAAANALLKALEEPLLDTTLILLAHTTRDMLPTILSRCTQLRSPASLSFSSCDFQTIEAEIEAIEDPIAKSERFDAFLASLLMRARDRQAQALRVAPLLPDASPISHSVSIEELEELVQTARLAHQRNIKLSACLDILSSKLAAL